MKFTENHNNTMSSSHIALGFPDLPPGRAFPDLSDKPSDPAPISRWHSPRLLLTGTHLDEIYLSHEIKNCLAMTVPMY